MMLHTEYTLTLQPRAKDHIKILLAAGNFKILTKVKGLRNVLHTRDTMLSYCYKSCEETTVRCFPALKTKVMTERIPLLSSWEITYVLKNNRSLVAKWKLNTSTFKVAIFNQNLGTEGKKKSMLHSVINQVIVVLSKKSSNSRKSINCAEILAITSWMLPLQNVS